ncbi:nitroreductase family protein [Camelliibacillus cellulosilyticus]|uniref:Nitroreductase family protein n=1 Tax=Camelliibacillus cellulosilyticus TaxID=2174486 RepID=A0ABV9GNG9_9BACL
MAQIIMEDIHQHRRPTVDIDPLFLNRWSPRSFQDKPVPEDHLFSLFEAARWAPSCMNFQPWRFLIARTETERQKWFPFINDGNRIWCEKAPVLTLILSQRWNPDGKPNRFHAFDTGAAWGAMALRAVQLGLATHGMAGYNPDAARELLNIPDEYDILALVAIGYQGEKEVLPEAFQEREKPSDRKPLKDIIFEGQFGQTIDI